MISPITGREITDRGALRRHLKAHGVAPAEDVSVTAARVRADRARRERAERLSAVRDSYEHVRNQERAKSRFG